MRKITSVAKELCNILTDHATTVSKSVGQEMFLRFINKSQKANQKKKYSESNNTLRSTQSSHLTEFLRIKFTYLVTCSTTARTSELHWYICIHVNTELSLKIIQSAEEVQASLAEFLFYWRPLSCQRTAKGGCFPEEGNSRERLTTMWAGAAPSPTRAQTHSTWARPEQV